MRPLQRNEISNWAALDTPRIGCRLRQPRKFVSAQRTPSYTELAVPLLLPLPGSGGSVSRKGQQIDQELIQQILGYFLRNPRAADTLEGITRWRLLDERMHQSLEETSRALDWLVSKGLLIEETTPVSGRLFRLDVEKTAEIDLFLKGGRRHHTAPED